MFLIFYYLYKKYQKNIENFNDTSSMNFLYFNIFINILISIYATHLSLTCKWGSKDTDYISKFFFAIFAFLLGLTYLIYYFIFNYLPQRCSR